mmetsp:Transcript_12263/g.16648  ORF Transcript_12263/g.16648 Transcript_12263/m.16648 type:complete len:130 (+) Transcript_12263:1593-1982(+)|eukprot:CAMPEP_0185623062 /NCGR_PEP_ID=MMETSP0436-20130131/59615_1 /TAXON_ID=626734 ORGANISM="Favella taraikaensis, Strain Fe Narragansett Bay" /NCGR_SAMPLE_ID=MMETSP0436 /ASSEMBLY_ACC=CAM_ASM_000390 /LENGTH=129 /DNA_ID=CAMNT_0028264955 /DNA_START=1390 /DNA_END=1779 /DNA_ORIENTATION=-
MQAGENDFTSRALVRASASSVPGMVFTDYQSTLLYYSMTIGVPVMISTDAYKTMLDTTWAIFPERSEAFHSKTEKYSFSDNIPKEKCFVKLKEGITHDEEALVISGIQGVLTDRNIVVMQTSLLKETLE